MGTLSVGLAILLLISFLGARLQGISLSLLGGLGVLLFIVLLQATPAEPPFKVILCVMTVVIAVGAIEAAGGLSYLVHLAEILIRKHPHRVVYISPMVTYVITFLAGTNHIAYSILPVIAEVSREVGVRSERPLSLSVIAALHGALASPISSIMMTLAGCMNNVGIGMVDIFKIVIPSTFGGVCIATFVMSQCKLTMDNIAPTSEMHTATTAMPTTAPQPNVSKHAKRSIACFLIGSMAVVLIDAIPMLRPTWELNGIQVKLPTHSILPLVMLCTACTIMLLCRLSPKAITHGKAFTAGIQGMLALLGTAWLSSTFVESNATTLLAFISSHLTQPWQFSIILFFMSAIMGSSMATVKAIFPLGLALSIPPKILLASTAAVNGVFLIPIYPTILAAINLDTTGTTRIGKYLFNHSFMLPGLITVAAALAIGFGLVYQWG